MNDLLTWLAVHVKDNPLVWAQAVHFLLGYATLLSCYRAGERRRFWRPYLGLGLVAFFLEAWFDPRYEGDPFLSWSGGLLDLLCYLLGGLLGVAVDAWD